MKIIIDFDSQTQEAILETTDMPDYEISGLLRIIDDIVSGATRIKNKIYLPWRAFLITRPAIIKFAKAHSIDQLELTEAIKPILQVSNSQSYSVAIKLKDIPYEEIKNRLNKAGFERKLTENQLFNLSHLGNLCAAATFSVPGAGKTTEALAYFFLNAEQDDRLLVVAPKNAFGSWDEQLRECVPTERSSFVRLRGGEKNIEGLLRKDPRYMLITYQQYPKVKHLIRGMLEKTPCFMFLDESHKIKSGKNIVSADAILEASYLPKRKLIMSGTPMPQSEKDLIPQIQFLYPEKRISPVEAINTLQPIYVRTTKGQLGIPEMERRLVPLKMDPLQEQIYKTLKSETTRQLMSCLSDTSKQSLREIGKCVMKMMQFVSNPALLAKDIEYAFDDRIGELLLTNNGPKIEYACQRARQLAEEGKKVIIWTTFVENIQLITTRLEDLGADYIDGKVDTGSEEENDTREWKIKEFHDNPNKWVLVANPAAASEGISLHRVCQYALYVDRSFNAAQYLQSEDRIHRLGLKEDQVPCVEIIECENTIDEVIRKRLEAKVSKMADALNDQSLKVDVIPYDFEYDESDEDGLDKEDVDAIFQYFFGGVGV